MRGLNFDGANPRVKRVRDHIVFRSGTFFKITVDILDRNGKEYLGIDPSRAELRFYGQDANRAFLEIQNSQITAAQGKYTFVDLPITLLPGSTAYAEFIVTDMKDFGNDIDFVDNPPLILFTARPCEIGEYYSIQRTCEVCPSGTYSFLPMTQPAESCPPCPINAICPDDKGLYPSAGHVRFHDNSQIIVKCFNELACLEGDADYPMQQCAEGYDGVMCATCEPGYWKARGTHECHKCEFSYSTSLTWTIIGTISFVVVILVLNRQMLENFNEPNQETIAYYRILISLFHFMYIVNSLQDSVYNIGAYIWLKQQIDYLTHALNPFFWLVDLSCVDTGWSREDQFYNETLIVIALPVAIFFTNVVIWSIDGLITRLCSVPEAGEEIGFNRQRIFNKILITFSMWTYLPYPMIVTYLLQSVNCYGSLKTDGPFDEPVQRLRVFPNIECSDERYVQYFYFCFIPGILLYVFVLPGYVINQMIKNRAVIYNSSRAGFLRNNV